MERDEKGRFVKGMKSPRKGKSNKEFHGEKKANEISKKMSLHRKDKNWEEIYGKEKSEIKRKNLSEKYKGNGNPFFGKNHTKKTKKLQSEKKEGYIPINKGKKKENCEFVMRNINNAKETKKRLISEGKINTTKNLGNYAKKGKCSKEKNPFFGKKHKFKSRIKQSASKQGINLRNWERFTSFEPYNKNFNKEFKKLIKERDGCCMLCNIGFEDLKLLKRKVAVHHIDYNKLLSIPQNCISLCNSCHSKTNVNRKYWKKLFQDLSTERYEYKYSENGEIILEIKNGIK